MGGYISVINGDTIKHTKLVLNNIQVQVLSMKNVKLFHIVFKKCLCKVLAEVAAQVIYVQATWPGI